jgi:putative membrane protein
MHWGVHFWPLFPLFWIAIIVLFCWFVGSFFRGWRRPFYSHYMPHFMPDALEILRQRYASGEIDGTTFDQMRERLEGSTGEPRS